MMENTLNSLFDSNSVAIVHLSHNLQILKVNRSFLDFSQKKETDLIKSDFSSLFPSPAFIIITHEVIKNGIPYFHNSDSDSSDQVFPYLLKDEIWALIPIQTDEIAPKSLILAIFSKNKKQFVQKKILSHIVEGICIVRMEDGIIVETDRTFEKMFGYEPGEMIGKEVSTINAPTEYTPEETRENIMDGLKKYGAWKGEVKNLNKEGKGFWCNANVFVMDHPEFGEVLISVHTDITERKEQEEYLRFQSQIITNLAEGVCLVNIDSGLIVFTNPAFEKMFGYNTGEMIGLDVSLLNAPTEKSPEETKKEILNIITETREFHGEVYNIRKDGTPFWTYGNVSLFNHPKYGKVLASVQTDITKQKELEEDKLRALKIESISLLAGGIAHDFNNILSAILGNVNLIQLKIQNEPSLVKMLDLIEKSVKKANSLTKQLLTFSKGGTPIKETESIISIVEESAKFILHGSKSKYHLETIGKIPPVEVDEGQMNQVINNLLLNAADSMKNGGIIEIIIDTMEASESPHIQAESGRFVRIRIQDHGVGISKENQLQIFNPYFSTKIGGNGLGLATCYSIITNHNGFITFKSELGVGTEFSVFLPASLNKVKKKPKISKETPSFSGKVLVIEDDVAIQTTLSKMLTQLGFEVTVVSTGTSGVHMFQESVDKKQPYSLIICDLTIPGDIGGKESMRRILEIDSQAIGIVSSGYSQDPVLAHFEKYGFKGILNKPYTFDHLKELLTKIFQ